MLYCVLFCLPALATLGGAIYLLARKKKSHVTDTMANVLLILSVSIFCYAQYYNPAVIERQSWGFDLVYGVIAPFCAPVYFLFLNRLTEIRRSEVKEILAFAPSVILVLLLVYSYLMASDVERHAYIGYITQGKAGDVSTQSYEMLILAGYQLFRVILCLQVVLVIVYGIFRLKSYVNLLGDYYSTIDSTDVIRIRGIHSMSIVIIIMAMSLSMLPTHEWGNSLLLVALLNILEVVIVVRIVIYSDKVDYTAESLSRMIEATAPGQSDATSASEGVLLALMEKMDDVMVRDRLFLNPSLSLIMLSEAVGTNRTYVSQAIKQFKGCNFSDYVNRFRIDYALDLMGRRSPGEIIVQNIAAECGCGSTQTFYRYFKMFCNTTPTVWLEHNSK